MYPEFWTHIYELDGTHGCFPVFYRRHPFCFCLSSFYRIKDMRYGHILLRLKEYLESTLVLAIFLMKCYTSFWMVFERNCTEKIVTFGRRKRVSPEDKGR